MCPAFLPEHLLKKKNLDDQKLLTSMQRRDYALAKLHSFSYESSVLGVRPAMDTERHWVRRLIWAVLLAAGIALAIYQIQNRIVNYASYPTTTSVSIAQADSLPFPQVTICNENRMIRSVATSLGFQNVLPEMFPLFPTSSGYPHPNVSFMTEQGYSSQEWDEIRYNLSQPLASTFSFGIYWGVNSLSKEILTPVWTNMGLCYAFNAAGYNYTTTKAGATLGLMITMQTLQQEYLVANSPCAGFRLVISRPAAHSNDLRCNLSILLHDPLELPTMLESAFLVAPGMIASISMTLENITDLGPPYSTCNDDPYYRQVNCQNDCLRDFIIQSCSCKMNYMRGPARNCTIVEEYLCVNPALASPELIPNLTATCTNCPRQCNSHVYLRSVTASVMSEEFKSLVVSEGIPETTLVENFVGIQIFYSSLQYNDVAMSAAYEFMGMLSDVGGALGLMLGATLITLWEIAEFCYQLVKNVIGYEMQAHAKTGIGSKTEKVGSPQ